MGSFDRLAYMDEQTGAEDDHGEGEEEVLQCHAVRGVSPSSYLAY